MGITRKEALDCFASDDLIGIGMEAAAVRRHLHPEGVVSYCFEGSITCTNKSTFESIATQVSQIVDHGSASITLQGEPSPDHTLSWFEGLFRFLKQSFPGLWLHCLSASEILPLSTQANLSLHDTIARLRDSGLDSIPGNDAGILDDAVRHTQSARCTNKDWIAVHRIAHRLGIETTATMIFGAGETPEHRLNHLETLYQLQQETGGFASFTPWASMPQSVASPGFEEATAVEYLKTLAISRMILDNVPNVQSNLDTQGLKVLQVGLRFGANDVGNIPSANGVNAATEEQVRQIIRDAGFKPVQRDTLYRTMFLN